GRSVVRDGDAVQTGRAGRDRGGLGRPVVALRQVAERERRRPGSDRQRAGGVGSRVVRIGQRGHNGVAAGVGGRRGRSIVSDRDAAQTGGAGRGGDGLRRSIVGLRQIGGAACRGRVVVWERAGGFGSRVGRIWQRR